MKLQHLIHISLTLLLFSCDNHKIEPSDNYFINFTLMDEAGKRTDFNLPYKFIQDINGNGVKGSDSVWVGFGFSANFDDPGNNAIQQELTFHVSFQIPEDELTLDSSSYYFNNSSDFLKYISTENIYEAKQTSFSTFFHEDLNTFCSAQNDQAYNNSFIIEKKEFLVDENNKDAFIAEGKFETKYYSICQNEAFKITKGTFRIKVLIDKIP